MIEDQAEIAAALQACADTEFHLADRLAMLYPPRDGIGPHNYAPWLRAAATTLRRLAVSLERYDGSVMCGGCGEDIPVAEAIVLPGNPPLVRCARCAGEEAPRG